MTREPAVVERQEPPDADIVAAVRRGVVDAYRVLVRRHQGRLVRYAERMTGDADRAKDLVQSTLIRGYDRLHQCRQPDRFGHWVLGILANECRHAARRTRYHLSLDDVGVATLAAAESASAEMERHELHVMLARALARLPVPQREAFLLRHVEDLTYEEMASVAGASVAALKQRVHRARASMSAFLEETF